VRAIKAYVVGVGMRRQAAHPPAAGTGCGCSTGSRGASVQQQQQVACARFPSPPALAAACRVPSAPARRDGRQTL